MSKVVFEYVEYKNFRAVGNVPIRIELNTHKTTLICGTNGAGKTTTLSAICFALFGRGFGDITKPSLVNSINQKQLLVTTEFTIGTKRYKINRGIKPNIFEIFEDGVLKNQDPDVRDYQKVLEQQILKFNYRAFTQVVAVVGGDDFVPFMKLSALNRREFVEDLLDIRVFSTMNTIIKAQAKDTKDELKDLTSSLTSLKDKIALQSSFIKKLQSDKTATIEKLESLVTELKTQNNAIAKQVKELTATQEGLKHFVAEHEELDEKLTSNRIAQKQLKRSKEKLEEKCSFYNDLIECPTCKQDVGVEHKKNITSGYDLELANILSELSDLTKEERELTDKIASIEGGLQSYYDTQTEITGLNRDIFSNNRQIVSYQTQLTELEVDEGDVDVETAKLRKFAVDYKKKDAEKKAALTLQEQQLLIQQVLSDSGIKSKIIKQYIPTINKLINKFLADFDFFVLFNLDEEFNETIKSRHRDNFKYGNFSNGQKRRIDLAIMLTWMEIAKAKNALHTNIVFFDEIDAPLDADGAEMLHTILKECSSENIFLISHKGDVLTDKVDNVIEFKLHNNFTERV